MSEFWIKEWNIGRVCISVCNEWLLGYDNDKYGRSLYLGFISLTLFDGDEDD